MTSDNESGISPQFRPEELARTILESISDAFFSLGPDWKFTYANAEAGRILSRPVSEIIGKSIWDEYPGLYGSDFEPIYRNAMDNRVAGIITQFYPDHDRWYEVRTYPAMQGICVFFRDVTKEKRMADDFARQSRLFERIASVTPDFIYTFDRDGRFLYANKRLLEVWGITFEQAIGKSLTELGYPDWHAAMHLREIRQVIETKKSVRGEVPFTGGSGVSGIYEYIFTPVLGTDGEVEVIAGTTRDVTARRNLEAEREKFLLALNAEKSNLESIVEQAPAFICTLRGPTHIFELANERYLELVDHRNLVGRTVREVFPDIAGQGFFELLDNVYRTGEPFVGNEVPIIFTRRDGSEQRFINFVYQALRDADGNISGIFVHGVDVTDSVRARDAVRQSAEQIRLVMSNVKDHAIFTLDLEGNVTAWNFGAERVFGYTSGEIVGHSAAILFTAEDRKLDRPATEMRLALTGAGVAEDTRYHLRKDGSQFFSSGSLEVLRDDAGNLRGYVKVVRDITERKRAEDERQALLESERAARQEAERAGRMKDEFLATLSHEIRTPLNSILGWSHIMRASNSAEDIKSGLDVIERNARAQSQIIEDLLDMSRIISGKVRLDVQGLDLAMIVQSAVETARPTAEAKGVRLGSVIDPMTGVTVSGDANRLQQVLWNLISNAIKFTPRGGRVQVLLERVNSHLEISVIDTGEGIPPEFLPFVFDRFRQADASTTRKHGGLGLGLSIVKQLVELHGGSVRVKSAGQGRGTTFIVALPLLPLHPEPEQATERRHPRTAPISAGSATSCDDIAGVRVLLIDDEPDARALVKRLLEDCDAIVTSAESVDEAVKLVETRRFDVLISDIGMPGEDGYALIKRVRLLGKERGGNIPAIALTAYARAEDRVKAVSSGFMMHVAKPVEPVELITMVAGAAGRTGPTP